MPEPEEELESHRISPHRGLRIRGNTHRLASMSTFAITTLTDPFDVMDLRKALEQVSDELAAARRKFPDFHSAHEGFAILKEEVDELWAEVKRPSLDSPGVVHIPSRRDAMRAEAIQVAAMAIRFIMDCCK